MEYSNSPHETDTRYEIRLQQKPANYEFVVDAIKGFGRCASWKDLDIEFGGEFDDANFARILDLALERGDLVKPTLGCVCAPEFAAAHPPSDAPDEWDSDVSF